MNRMILPGVVFSGLLVIMPVAEVAAGSMPKDKTTLEGTAPAAKKLKAPAGRSAAKPASGNRLKAKPHVVPGIEGTDVSTSGYADEGGGDGCTSSSKEEHC